MQKKFKNTHEWNMADTVTTMRMGASVFLLFLSLEKWWFLVVYTFAGLTDILDGWIARKSQSASEFGAKLDSIADLLFYGVLLFRLFPLLFRILPREMWYAVLGIIAMRLVSYAVAAVKYHRFASLHTWLNKLTGAAVFLLPYVLFSALNVIYCWAVCSLAFAASAEELAIHLFRADYIPERKTFLQN